MPQGTGGSGRDRQRSPEAPRPEGYQAPDPDRCGVPYRDEAYGFVYVG